MPAGQLESLGPWLETYAYAHENAKKALKRQSVVG
jgi:hypothetical protein